MAQLFTPPYQQTLDANAEAISGARLYFYITGTTTPAAVFADGDLSIPLPAPVVADAAGRFVPIYLDPAIAYRVVVADSSGSVIRDVDPLTSIDGIAQDLADGGGLGLVGFRQDAFGAIDRTALAKARETVSVLDFGAKGDGTTDDTTAIQAALDYVGGLGGGTVILPPTTGRYRITSGLKMPSYTTLQGIAAARYPFNAGNRSTLVADFTNQLQWVIDTKTTHGGTAFAYNELTTARLPGGGLPNGPTFNCTIRDLVITSTATTPTALPYGGIRLIGCPGSIVDNVAVQNVGTGMLVNCCFGGRYSIHTLTAYYGVVAWDDVNGNSFEVYAARQEEYIGVVPDAYQTAAYNGLFNNYVSVHGLAKNDHFNRSTGLIFGSAKTTSGTNVVEYVGERWQNGFFSLYAYALNFTKFYVESGPNITLTAVAGARSNITFSTFHSYLSGGGEHFDTGFVQNMDVRVNGIVFAGSFGRISNDTASFMTIRGRTPTEFGPAAPQYNVVNEKQGAWMAPTMMAPWQASGSDFPIAYRREGSRVYLAGEAVGGTANTTIATVPAGSRPPQRMPFDKFYVTASGEIVARVNGPIALSGFSYEAIS